MIMSSVSEDYSRDGETYSDLWSRMESMMIKYELVELELQNVQVALSDNGATATSMYSARYKTTAGESLAAAGALSFQLSRKTGYWKITRIDSQ